MFLTNNDAPLLQAVLGDPTLDLQTLLDRGLVDDGSHRAPGIHASEISRCLRMAGYSLRGYTKTSVPDAESARRFNIGHGVHEVVQRALKKGAERTRTLQVSVDVEVPCGNTPLGRELCIDSSCDGVVTFSKEGSPLARIGIEIKSEDPDLWKKRTKPSPDHLEQSLLYMATLDLPAIWIVYINKSSGKETPFAPPFVVPFDPAAWALLRAKIEKVLHADTVADLPETESSYTCKICPYRSHCKGNAPLLLPAKWKPAKPPRE